MAVVRAPRWRYRLRVPRGQGLVRDDRLYQPPAPLSEGRRRRVPRPSPVRGRPRLGRDHGSGGKEEDAVRRMGKHAGPGLVHLRRGDLVHGDPRGKLPRPLRRDARGARTPGAHDAREGCCSGHRPRWTRPPHPAERAGRILRPRARPGQGSGTSRAWSGRMAHFCRRTRKTAGFHRTERVRRSGYSVYVRNLDGSPAVRLGTGLALAISADGKWVLACQIQTTPPTIVLLPTGAGTAEAVPEGLDRQGVDHVRGRSLRTESASYTAPTRRESPHACSSRISRAAPRSPSRRRA